MGEDKIHMWRSENKRQESVFSFHHVAPRVPLLTEPAHQSLFFFFIQKLLEILFPLWSIPGDTGDTGNSKWVRLTFTEQAANGYGITNTRHQAKLTKSTGLSCWRQSLQVPRENTTLYVIGQRAITLISKIAINYNMGHMMSTLQHIFTKYKPATDGNQTVHNPEPGSFWKQHQRKADFHQKELPCSKTSEPELLGPYLSIPKDSLGQGRWLTW